MLARISWQEGVVHEFDLDLGTRLDSIHINIKGLDIGPIGIDTLACQR